MVTRARGTGMNGLPKAENCSSPLEISAAALLVLSISVRAFACTWLVCDDLRETRVCVCGLFKLLVEHFKEPVRSEHTYIAIVCFDRSCDPRVAIDALRCASDMHNPARTCTYRDRFSIKLF